MKPTPSPLQQALQSRVQLLATTLRPGTVQQYQHTVRWFLAYLAERFPEVRAPSQLRRDPHLLRWLEQVWLHRSRSSGKRLSNHSRAAHLIRLRKLFHLLADHAFPPRPGLLLREDIPPPDHTLPRPLTPEDDDTLQAQWRLATQDLLSQTLLLMRLTGIRIGEAVDLPPDYLRHVGGNHWALHVPIGKLHSERWVPVDAEVRAIVARLRFLATLAPAAPIEFLLPRPKGRSHLCSDLRAHLRTIAAGAGITAPLVPHQLRHTYATTLLRAGVGLPALMKLLGHRTAQMTLRYVEITQQDLQREFHLARQHRPHRMPLPASLADSHSHPDRPDASAVLQRLTAAIRLLDSFRQHHAFDQHDKPLRLLLRRLVRIRSRFEKLIPNTPPQK